MARPDWRMGGLLAWGWWTLIYRNINAFFRVDEHMMAVFLDLGDLL